MPIRPVVLLLCVLASGAACALLTTRRERGADDLRAARARDSEIADQQQALRYRNAEGDRVARELVAGELSLDGAVRELEDINRSRLHEMRSVYYGHFPSWEPSDREVLAYYAITRVRCASGVAPERRYVALDRIEREYRELFNSDPPVDPLDPALPGPRTAVVRD